MPKVELDGLPVVDAPDSEEITIVVSPDDLQAGDMKNPERHPVAIALRRQRGVDDARVSKREVLIRRVSSGSDTNRQRPYKASAGRSATGSVSEHKKLSDVPGPWCPSLQLRLPKRWQSDPPAQNVAT